MRRRPIIERLLQKPLLSILSERKDSPETTLQRWREEYPEEAVTLAMKMANNWLEKVTK